MVVLIWPGDLMLNRFWKFQLSKAELLKLKQTEFPSLGIFVCKKVGNFKNEDHFHYVSFKSFILGGLSFFRNPTFFLIKITKEGNWVQNRIPSCGHSALVKIAIGSIWAKTSTKVMPKITWGPNCIFLGIAEINHL